MAEPSEGATTSLPTSPTLGEAPIDALDATVSRARHSALYGERLRDVRVRGLEDWQGIPLTTRGDLQAAGIHGTRAAPLEQVCHYGESSGTSGATNSTWLTAEDFACNARIIAARHPELFGPGRILLNRFPFMAAPAHLLQLIAQQGNGVSIPAGNINWDVPFPRALELAQQTGAQTLAGFPIEPIVLAQIARARGLEPAKATSIDAFFLGGAALPPSARRRIERVWQARVVELYGSTETMLLGTGCAAGSLHLEPELAHCEVLHLQDDTPCAVGEEGRFIVTTIALEGSPLVRFDTGDVVKRLPPCSCGDLRPSIIVLGRAADAVEIAGQRLHAYDIVDAAAAAADALDSSVFFTIVLPDRLLVRIETDPTAGTPASGDRVDPLRVLRDRLGNLKVEVETTGPNELLDVEQLSRSPSVYKPVVVSDWRRPGRRVMSISQGMIEWPRPTFPEIGRLLARGIKASFRRRRLGRELRVAKASRR